MSFMGGAECSTAGNPLSQFSKIGQDDKSLQRDRLVGRGPGSAQGMRSTGMNGNQDNMMNEFLQQGGQLPQAPVDPFMMEAMHHAGPGIQRGTSPQASGWAQEFQPGLPQESHMQPNFQTPQSAGFNPAEFSRFQQMNQPAAARTASPATQMPMSGYNSYQRPMGMGMGMGMGGFGMGGGMMYQNQSQMPMNQQPQEAMDKGKGKMIELDDKDWEEQFKAIDLAAQEREQNDTIEAELNQMDRDLVADMPSPNELDMGSFDQWDGFDGMGSHAAFRDPHLGDYTFEADNIFADVPNAFEEGVRIMEEGGNLSLAALAFEAAVQRDSTHLAAWVHLGSAQAQNEKETPAIRALEQALKIDPSNLEALMGLAVSYTNEGYDSTAYRTLERWLSVKYPAIAPPSGLSAEADIGFTDRQQLHEKVTNLFIQAAQLSPDAETMDPDVQVGLGVLFYGAEEYDKAVDCFSAALASTESGSTNDSSSVHLLWNRLGATLANSGRSEEAINAYERALSMRGNFVRARYNLGVSCINIGCYEEAAAHLLGALAMHKVAEQEGREKAKDILGGDGAGKVSEAELERLINQNQSTNLYDTLRRVFSQMNRRDLAERVVSGMDVDSFRGDFDF
ncbi:hypothetical protein O988_02857 [Pseudogymnoascus sp. VKM F-3808]|nr:hypothetical protein V490_06802 [Pseudogymnoascus sp. VKM F-3557]KFY01224.1 hypothetical protein O988_02857 [Pseudogymnoascus sp. VKM F-3808]KFY38857.1 hypothetical protein V495_06336 [Pseudogymnoascus sp. VKM F-4514 (FW-929)]KFY51398.1 hypothetical protein V497_09164 [Pseudogymnoascus sp. VKM F-4516 (FW-969)]